MAPLFEDSDTTLSDSESSISGEGCWYVVCEIGNTSMHSLVDSGANRSIMNYSVHSALDEDVKTFITNRQPVF